MKNNDKDVADFEQFITTLLVEMAKDMNEAKGELNISDEFASQYILARFIEWSVQLAVHFNFTKKAMDDVYAVVWSNNTVDIGEKVIDKTNTTLH